MGMKTLDELTQWYDFCAMWVKIGLQAHEDQAPTVTNLNAGKGIIARARLKLGKR